MKTNNNALLVLVLVFAVGMVTSIAVHAAQSEQQPHLKLALAQQALAK